MKILYCTSPFNFTSPRGLMTSVPDKLKHEINKDIISICKELNLRLDIKVHPHMGESNVDYFKRLVSFMGNKATKVMAYPAAEKLILKYDLILTEHLSSALVPVFLVIDKPVIAYLKNTSYLRRETYPDLKNRFYIVKNKKKLKRKLILFKQGRLGKLTRKMLEAI